MNAPNPVSKRKENPAEPSWIDQIADRFEAAWKCQSSPPALEDFLAQAEADSKVALLHELVKIDRTYRQLTGATLPEKNYQRFHELLPPGQAPRDNAVIQTDQNQKQTIQHLQEIEGQGPCVLPDTIGRYRVLAHLGAGAQGEVFRCFDPVIGRDVAIKIGKKRRAKDGTAWDAYVAEAQAMAHAEHPSLVRVYDHGIHQDRPYIVTEFVQGCSLDKWLHRPLSARAAAILVARLARGLGAVHRCNLTHQDLKPANVLIDQLGQPRIIDFGMAQHRTAWSPDSGTIGGTPAYMAPEQANGEVGRVGPATDIFGVGGVLFFALSGKAPLADKDVEHALARARRGDINHLALVQARVPRRLRDICRRALAFDPADRQPGAEVLARELESYLSRPRRALVAGACLALAGVSLALWLCCPSVPADDVSARQIVAEVPAWQTLIEVLERKGRIFKPDSGQKLQSLAPLQRGDRLVLRCDVPLGCVGGFFCMDASGRVRQLTPVRSNCVRGHVRLRFPATGSWLIDGPPGTMFLLVCANRLSKPEKSQVEQALLRKRDFSHDWPALSPGVILVLNREDVEPYGEELSRDFVTTPFTTVSNHLEIWRARLQDTFDFSWGVALPQE
jgi:hypothetical protein